MNAYSTFADRVAACPVFAYLKGHGSTFCPDLQAQIDQLVIETGRTPDELVEDAMAGYVAEFAETREMLNSRYDDLKSGTVKPVDGEEFFENLRRRENALPKQ